MMDINSIIEMINKEVRPIGKVHDEYRSGYDDACDDIIEQLRKMSDKKEDWQVCVIGNTFIEEIDCNSGKKRKIFNPPSKAL